MSLTTNDRLTRLQVRLTQDSLDAIIITNKYNLRYLCGFTGSAGVLIVTGASATLYVDARYTTQSQKEVTGAQAVVAPRPVLANALAETRVPLTRVGFEANHVTFAEYEEMRALGPDTQWIGLRGAVEALRAVKDKGEVERIQRAIDIADQVFADFCSWCRPGMSEHEVAARLEYEQRRLGGELNASGVTIVASGWRTCLPHGVATHKAIEANDPVMIDIGTVIEGYCSDLTRTVQFGRASPEFLKLYQLVYDAQQRAIDGLRPGISAAEGDALAHDVIKAAGYALDHSLGHSLGLDVHERPFLHPQDKSKLQEDMVFTVEPGVYVPNRAGVRIEDVVEITAQGCRLLTHSNRRLVEL